MTAALRYEWARLTSLRSTWWVSVGAVVAGGAFTFLIFMLIRFSAPDDLEGSVDKDFSTFFLKAGMTQFSNVDPVFYITAFAIAILGVLSWGHEYRHGMIRATLTAVPNRTAVWAAKFLTVGAWSAVIVAISCVLSFICTVVWLSGFDLQYDWGNLLLAVGQRMVYTVLLVWLVMAVTELIRHQTFSIAFLYLWPLGVEPLLRVIFAIFGLFDKGIDELARFLPFNAGGRIIQDWSLNGGLDAGDGVFGNPLNAWGGFIVFGGFTLALMAASLYSFRTRDA